jgi:3-hydroxyisobutyrate dehydrogenase-like beta-hydroxyacid dehydrogenase
MTVETGPERGTVGFIGTGITGFQMARQRRSVKISTVR